MARWRRAYVAPAPAFDVTSAGERDFAELAALGAPLEICCAAVCALAHAEGDLAWTTAPVRHYLAASVLLDHCVDWRQDSAVGRPNLYTRTLLGAEDVHLTPHERTQRMLAAMLESPAVEAYLERVIEQLRLGAVRAAELGCWGFTSYLEAKINAVEAGRSAHQQGVEQMLAHAYRSVFTHLGIPPHEWS
jgi:hypothetical protein